MQVRCDSRADHTEAVRVLASFGVRCQTGTSKDGRLFLDVDESEMSRLVRENVVARLTSLACVEIVGAMEDREDEDSADEDEDAERDLDDDEDEGDEDEDEEDADNEEEDGGGDEDEGERRSH